MLQLLQGFSYIGTFGKHTPTEVRNIQHPAGGLEEKFLQLCYGWDTAVPCQDDDILLPWKRGHRLTGSPEAAEGKSLLYLPSIYLLELCMLKLGFCRCDCTQLLLLSLSRAQRFPQDLKGPMEPIIPRLCWLPLLKGRGWTLPTLLLQLIPCASPLFPVQVPEEPSDKNTPWRQQSPSQKSYWKNQDQVWAPDCWLEVAVWANLKHIKKKKILLRSMKSMETSFFIIIFLIYFESEKKRW